MSLEQRAYDDNFAKFHSAANDGASPNIGEICFEAWLLKTHFQTQGVEGEVIENGRGFRIADPLEPGKTIIVRDAVAFGHKPTIDGSRPAIEYARLWANDHVPEMNWLLAVDEILMLTRQEGCKIPPDDLANPNPIVLRNVQARDEALAAALRLNVRLALIVIGKNIFIRDANSGNVITPTSAALLLSSDTYHSVEEVPVRNRDGSVKTNDSGNNETRFKETLKSSYQAWQESPARRTYHGIEFAPNDHLSTGDARNPNKFNKWEGFLHAGMPHIFIPEEVSSKFILDHMLNVFHAGNQETFKYELQWLSHMLRFPQQKPHAHIVRFEPTGGTGKDIFQEMIRHRIVGRAHSAIASGLQQLCGRFNSSFENAIVIFGNEIAWGGSHDARDKIYDETASVMRSVEPKGVDSYEVHNYSRYYLHSNSERPAPVGKGDRRFLMLECRDIAEEYEQGKDDPRYKHYYDSLARASKDPAIVAHFVRELLKQDLTDFNMFKAPDTAAKREVIERELKAPQQWLLNLARSGELETENGVFALFEDKPTKIPRRDVQKAASEHFTERGRALQTKVGTALTKFSVAEAVETKIDGETRKFYIFPPLPELRAKVAKITGLTVDQCIEKSRVLDDREASQLNDALPVAKSDIL